MSVVAVSASSMVVRVVLVVVVLMEFGVAGEGGWRRRRCR